MDIKDVLMQARRTKIAVDGKHERIMQLREIAESTTRVLGDMPQGGHEPERMAKTIETIVDFERELADEAAQMVAAQKKARDIIFSLGRQEWRCVLELYYLNGYRWSEVAEAMNYSVDNIYKLREGAMKALELSGQIQNAV